MTKVSRNCFWGHNVDNNSALTSHSSCKNIRSMFLKFSISDHLKKSDRTNRIFNLYLQNSFFLNWRAGPLLNLWLLNYPTIPIYEFYNGILIWSELTTRTCAYYARDNNMPTLSRTSIDYHHLCNHITAPHQGFYATNSIHRLNLNHLSQRLKLPSKSSLSSHINAVRVILHILFIHTLRILFLIMHLRCRRCCVHLYFHLKLIHTAGELQLASSLKSV